jgi:hypothetical protein
MAIIPIMIKTHFLQLPVINYTMVFNSLIVFVFIILLRIDKATYGMMLRLLVFTIPFVIQTRGITE